MFRTLTCCALLVVCPLLAGAEQTVTKSETVIKLTVRPKAAPKPALRYLLLPELREMNPGNPIPNYLKCIMERDFSGKESLGRSALRGADRAARLDKPDWQILDKLKTDGISLLLPDVQQIRGLAAGLQERFRTELAQGRIDDALGTAKTMFAMSRHMSEHPTLIGGLVGIAIGAITINPLEEMLEHPDCPNLYWALTDLPSPFVPIAKGMEGERVLIASEFHELNDKEPMTEEQIKKLIEHIDKIQGDGNRLKPEETAKVRVAARSKDPAIVHAARQRLAEYGIPEERLARFPAGQVILLDENREYEVRRDEVMKLMRLPYWQIDALMPPEKPASEKSLFDLLLPAIIKVRQAEARLDQRIALLRHVEALRMYAAEHEGKLPDKLADITVPLPVDPTTGKPFPYERQGDTARIRGTPARGAENQPGFNIRYEITIRK